jgi:single-stranded-DNA-specific exonuclease
MLILNVLLRGLISMGMLYFFLPDLALIERSPRYTMISTPPDWIPPKTPPDSYHQALDRFPRAFHQVLYTRGFETPAAAESFLRSRDVRPDVDLSPAREELLLSIIEQATAEKQSILIYGDYDVDGISSAAALHLALQRIGASTSVYLPDRVDEGYGLNPSALEHIAASGVSLLITVDCGIRAVQEVAYAQKLGLKVIITDHHLPGDHLPPADLILNPHLDEAPEHSKLAGVGVVFLIIQALSKHYPSLEPQDYLDLAALGTVADVVPLQGVNRYLVHQGIRQLRNTRRQGLFSLMQIAGLAPGRISASDISFQLAPRLNAAGRLGKAETALELLLADQPKESGRLAQILERMNSHRKELTSLVVDSVEQSTDGAPFDAPFLFAVDPAFNQGVTGIAAGKLARKYHRPALIGQRLDEVSVFSCRSIPDFNITAALAACADLLQDYGGHPQAAGFTLANHNLLEFKQRFAAFAQDVLGKHPPVPRLQADAYVPLNALNDRLLSTLELLEPTGAGNRRPVFWLEKVSLASIRRVGSSQDHLKCQVIQDQVSLPGIGFSLGHKADQIPDRADLLVQFEENYFRGAVEKQLIILAIRNSRVGLPDGGRPGDPDS